MTVQNIFCHTDAAGTENFDKTYHLGYEVNRPDLSPFARVNRLRKVFFERPFDIDVERLRLVTQAYQQHENAPRRLQCAYAFENVLLNTTLYIHDDELIVGGIAAPHKAAPIYPEFCVNWIIDEILHHPFEEREHDQFYIRSEEDRKEILELCSWWKGRTIGDAVDGRVDEEQRRMSHMGKKIFQTTLYHYAGIGHLAIDYPRLMKLGYAGLVAEAKEKMAALDKRDVEYADKHEFYEAIIIMHSAAMKYLERYAALAESMAEKESDPKRKEELRQIAGNCLQLSVGAPKTFWQALQLFNVATSLILIESNGHSVSYGRMDQWLYPFYAEDMKKGILTKDFALELLEVEYIMMNNPTKLKDAASMAVRNGRSWGGESLTIGGVDRDGKDATNDVTMLLLEASAHTRMMNPWVAVRWHKDTPYELQVKAVECIRAGYAHPKLFNDEPAIKGMLRKGMTLEEARDYCVVGCVEIDLPGKEYGWHDAAYVNTPKIIELAINGGKDLKSGEQVSPDTGSLDTFKSFDEVLESVEKQFMYCADQMCSMLNVIDNAHRALKPLPYLSAFYEDCMNSGHDISAGGAKYNGSGPQAIGIGTCADSLTAIKQLVFDEKKFTGAELLQALKDNWEGHEKLYALVNSSKVHHYGNDDDYADEQFKFIFETYCRSVAGRPTPRGGQYNPGVYSVAANVSMGVITNASLDGRRDFAPVSDNMGPVHTDAGSHDIKGPTAITNSLTKVDHSLATNGTLMNMRFPEEAVSGVEGRDNLVSFIDTYMEKGAMHVQFNIMSADKMRAAQKHPEDYKDFLVRVAGYCAYFVELGRPLQNDLIQRTELHF